MIQAIENGNFAEDAAAWLLRATMAMYAQRGGNFIPIRITAPACLNCAPATPSARQASRDRP